jgi:hypothetical protein
MPNVVMKVTGRAVGASGEDEAFAEMVSVAIGGVAEHAHPTVQIGADDSVRVEVIVDKSVQSEVGEVLEQLLVDAVIESSVLAKDGHEVHLTTDHADAAHPGDDADPAPDGGVEST